MIAAVFFFSRKEKYYFSSGGGTEYELLPAGVGPHKHSAYLTNGSGVSTEDYGHKHKIINYVVSSGADGHTHELKKLI